MNESYLVNCNARMYNLLLRKTMDQVTMIQVVRTVDVTATLLAIEVGMQVLCPGRVIDRNVLRATASRLKKNRRGAWQVNECKGGLMVRRVAK